MPIPLTDLIGHWLAIFVTISILSYLYADNPFYKLAEHLFVGVSIGYVLVIQYEDTIKPNLIMRITDPALGVQRWLYAVPLILVVCLFLKLWRRFSWLGRFAVAFVIGIYAGQNIPNVPNSDLIAQVGATVGAVSKFKAEDGWTDVVGLILLVVGMVAGLVYFFFSIEHKGPIGWISRFGVWVLMIGFGASFGYTVQGRISLAVGRAMDVLGVTQSAAESAQYHSKLVTSLTVLAIFGTVMWLERRRKRLEANAS